MLLQTVSPAPPPPPPTIHVGNKINGPPDHQCWNNLSPWTICACHEQSPWTLMVPLSVQGMDNAAAQAVPLTLMVPPLNISAWIIGASRSEPHTSDVNQDFPFIYMYVSAVRHSVYLSSISTICNISYIMHMRIILL